MSSDDATVSSELGDWLISEYVRLGVGGDSAWQLDTTTNASFKLCSTYGQLLAVPAAATPEMMHAVARFRLRGRLPVLCWRDVHSSAVLLRCAQPGIGLTLRTSSSDEAWVKLLADAAGIQMKQLKLFDSRSALAAHANRFRGGGVEASGRYGRLRIEHCSLRNVHYVKKVVVALRRSGGYSLDAKAHWLLLQSALLRASMRLAAHLDGGGSALLHCSDGWDRTPQMSALAQLILDPHYRTPPGFALLVEKEWVQFGHRFALRRNLGQPIFLQFLDAVYQLLSQKPDAFAFNDRFLRDIAAMHDGRPPSANDADGATHVDIGHHGGGTIPGSSAPSEASSPLPLAPFDADCEAQRRHSGSCGSAEGCTMPRTVWDVLLADHRRQLYHHPAHTSGKPHRLAIDCRVGALHLWEPVLSIHSSTRRVGRLSIASSARATIAACLPCAAPTRHVSLSDDLGVGRAEQGNSWSVADVGGVHQRRGQVAAKNSDGSRAIDEELADAIEMSGV